MRLSNVPFVNPSSASYITYILQAAGIDFLRLPHPQGERRKSIYSPQGAVNKLIFERWIRIFRKCAFEIAY
jgi:hypothetical protein